MMERRVRNLLLLDAIGAILSSLSLLLILPHFSHYFSVPPRSLLLLGICAGIVTSGSLFAALISRAPCDQRLMRAAIANSAYIFITIAALFTSKQDLTGVDQIYFAGETAIILTFIFQEIALRNRILKSPQP
jgi:hypothetical protein